MASRRSARAGWASLFWGKRPPPALPGARRGRDYISPSRQDYSAFGRARSSPPPLWGAFWASPPEGPVFAPIALVTQLFVPPGALEFAVTDRADLNVVINALSVVGNGADAVQAPRRPDAPLIERGHNAVPDDEHDGVAVFVLRYFLHSVERIAHARDDDLTAVGIDPRPAWDQLFGDAGGVPVLKPFFKAPLALPPDGLDSAVGGAIYCLRQVSEALGCCPIPITVERAQGLLCLRPLFECV
jgi:hypothetical protein